MKKIIIVLVLFTFVYKAQPQNQAADLQNEIIPIIKEGNYDKCIDLLEKNISWVKDDTTGLFNAIINLQFFKKNWKKIVDLYAVRNVNTHEDTSILSMARFYMQFENEKINVSKRDVFPCKYSVSGSPVVEVKVNGKKYNFWFDTRAGLTVVSSKVAEKCKIKQPTINAKVLASTGKVVSQKPGLIDSLKIGNTSVVNHHCMIIDKKNLELKVLGITIFKIDGIIGWNLMQELDITIDNKLKQITLAHVKSSLQKDKNFFWYEKPFILASDSAKQPLLFFIDTGANKSGLYEKIISKVDTNSASKKVIRMGGVGGVKKIKAFVLPSYIFVVDNHKITMQKITITPGTKQQLFSPEGILGMKELKNKKINFSIQEGFFRIEE